MDDCVLRKALQFSFRFRSRAAIHHRNCIIVKVKEQSRSKNLVKEFLERSRAIFHLDLVVEAWSTDCMKVPPLVSRTHGVVYMKFSNVAQLSKVFKFINSSKRT